MKGGQGPSKPNQADHQVGNVGKLKGGEIANKGFGKGTKMSSVRTTKDKYTSGS